MPTCVSKPPSHAERKRRVHAKSRKGCGNCKLRRVKCDELRPYCKRCILYGVDCNYGGSGTSLQLSAQGSFQVNLVSPAPVEQIIDFSAAVPRRCGVIDSSRSTLEMDVNHDFVSYDDGSATKASAIALSSYPFSDSGAFVGTTSPPKFLLTPFSLVSINSTMVTMIDDSLQLNLSATDMQPCSESISASSVSFWHFSEAHLEILDRFRHRTALTIGMKRMASAYRDLLCSLALQHAFLMHMLLSLTLMHDAHIAAPDSPSVSIKHKHAALQHWNTASKLFNSLLAKPIAPTRRDAVWATGVVIGAASFWYVNSNEVEEVWPLKPYEPEDLSWLRLGEGKRALWRIADPSRPDSVFSHLMKGGFSHCHSVPEWVDTYGAAVRAPEHLKRIFDITVTSTIDNNVYHLPILILSRIQNSRLTHSNVMSFLYVTAFITPKLLALLECKDARAVFLLGWWFKMIGDGELWWMASRARIEGRAVRIWLEREDKVYGLAQILDGLVRDGVGEMPEADLGLPINIWKHEWIAGRVGE